MAHTTNQSTHLLSAQTKKTRATQNSLPFGKRRFREKEVRRMGQKQKRSNRTYRQKNERGDIEKWDQTDSLRFQTSETPRSPFGGRQIDRQTDRQTDRRTDGWAGRLTIHTVPGSSALEV